MLYNITYTKVFIDGPLDGLEFSDSIEHTSVVTLDRLQARERLGEIVVSCCGGSNYTIKDVVGMGIR